MNDKSKAVVDLRKARNDRLIPRDPRRAVEYDVACAEIAKGAKQRIIDGEDALENRFLIALASGTTEDLDRSRKLLQQRKRSGIHVITSSSSD